MKPIASALRLFAHERGLWRYALAPLLWAAFAYASVVLMVSGAALGVGDWLGNRETGILAAFVGFALTVVLGGAIYLALVALIVGFGFDRLSIEVERRELGRSAGEARGFAAGLGDGLKRAFLAAVLGLVSLCGSGTVVIPLLAAALLGLLDFTAPALLRRGVGLGRQFGVARRLPGAIPFALLCGVVLLIPVVNVLALPILVAAGTILVAEGDVSFQEAPFTVPPASSR